MALTLRTVLFKEIAYSRSNFALGCLAVCAASTVAIAACAALNIHDLETRAMLADLSKTTGARATITTQRHCSRVEFERTEAILAPLALVAASLAAAFLTAANIRDRRGELAVMAVSGVAPGGVWRLLLARAAAIGLAGGLAGVVVGGVFATAYGAVVAPGAKLESVAAAAFAPERALVVLILALVLSMAVGLKAIRSVIESNPAVALR